MTEKRNTQPTVLSLFSGVGGFDLGLETAGMRTVYQCEIDRHARAVLEAHWPDVPRHDDITTLTGEQVVAACSEVDVVAWGSPCQDLSVAGKRAGLAGSRSSLFHEGMRVISEIRKATNGLYPRISIWENVAGALTSNDGHDFGLIIDTMAEVGAMVIEWAVLDAQHFGVPQRRRRVFVVAVFDSATAAQCTEPILPVRPLPSGHSSTSRGSRQGTARDNEAGFRGDTETTYEQLTLFENSYRDGPRISRTGVSQTLSAKMGTGGGNTPMVAYSIQGTVLGRQPQNGPKGMGVAESADSMYTLTATDRHAVVQQSDQSAVVRLLMPVECERLMGWSSDHTRWRSDGSEQTDNQRYKQCGNGVAAPVASWVGSQIIRIFSAVTSENEPHHKGNT